jgi:hypothetical protein
VVTTSALCKFPQRYWIRQLPARTVEGMRFRTSVILLAASLTLLAACGEPSTTAAVEWADRASNDVANDAAAFYKLPAELSRNDLERLLAPGPKDHDVQVTIRERMFEVRIGDGAACVSLLELSLVAGANTPATTEGPCPDEEPVETKKWRDEAAMIIVSRAMNQWIQTSPMSYETKEKGVYDWEKATTELAGFKYRDDVQFELDSERWVKATKGSSSYCFDVLYFLRMTEAQDPSLSVSPGPCDELQASTQG